MKHCSTIALLPLLLFSACDGQEASVSLAGSRPNIILVITDDQGLGDFSALGNPILQTPELDRFHAGSTRFTDFQVSSTCSPTRAALLSGRHAFEVGVTHTVAQRERLALGVVTLPETLQAAGYATGLFGKWHLGDEEAYLPQNRGFDEVLMHGGGGIGQYRWGDFKANSTNTYFDSTLLHNDTIVKTKGFCTDLFFSAGLAWMQKQLQAEQPFFTYLSLNAPHTPMIAPESYKKRFLDQGFAESTAARYGMIENIDDNFGRMMAKLEEWGALDNTLIIFMTDNGMNGRWLEYQDGSRQPAFNAGMRGHKGSSWEGGTNVPAFWSWQGVLPAGSDISALTAHIDLYRTLAELAGAELPEGAFKPNGRSMLPLLEDAQADWPDRKLFFHRGRWGFEHMSSGMTRADSRYDRAAVRTRQWRLVFDLEEGEQVIHLADIQADPGETTNLATQYPEVVEELTQAFDQWWVSTEPYLVNEGLPLIPESEHPFNLRYEAQLKTQGIPLWEPGG